MTKKKHTPRGEKAPFPLATVAHYGPDDRKATKVVVGIFLRPEDESGPLKRWYADSLDDIRNDRSVTEEIEVFITAHGVVRVNMVDRIIGCPHEEGIDYPEGTTCPQCPFWANRDRWTGELLDDKDDGSHNRP